MKWYLIYEGLPITYGERIKDGKGNEFKLISFDEPPKCNLRVVDSIGNYDIRPAEEFPVKFVYEDDE